MSNYARCYIADNVTKEDFIEIGINLKNDNNEYWLIDSKESFHGEFIQCKNSEVFEFMDNRFNDPICLTRNMVKIEHR